MLEDGDDSKDERVEHLSRVVKERLNDKFGSSGHLDRAHWVIFSPDRWKDVNDIKYSVEVDIGICYISLYREKEGWRIYYPGFPIPLEDVCTYFSLLTGVASVIEDYIKEWESNNAF